MMTVHEGIKVWRPPNIERIELKCGICITQAFARHLHEEFQLAVTSGGSGKFYFRGANHFVAPGSFTVIQSGEIHRVCSVDNKYRDFWALFVHPTLLQNAASELAGREKRLPCFPALVILDKYLPLLFLNLYRSLVETASLLEQQSLLLGMMVQLILRGADNCQQMQSLGREHQAVKRIRHYLEDNYAENISLEQLARIANFSPFYMSRVFSKEVGLSPHAYQTQVRILRAKTRLAQGIPCSQVAVDTGFASQSHFGLYFKRLVGVTPGQYVKNSKNFIDRNVRGRYSQAG